MLKIFLHSSFMISILSGWLLSFCNCSRLQSRISWVYFTFLLLFCCCCCCCLNFLLLAALVRHFISESQSYTRAQLLFHVRSDLDSQCMTFFFLDTTMVEISIIKFEKYMNDLLQSAFNTFFTSSHNEYEWTYTRLLNP